MSAPKIELVERKVTTTYVVVAGKWIFKQTERVEEKRTDATRNDSTSR